MIDLLQSAILCNAAVLKLFYPRPQLVNHIDIVTQRILAPTQLPGKYLQIYSAILLFVTLGVQNPSEGSREPSVCRKLVFENPCYSESMYAAVCLRTQ
jgi:hypothetical protein